MGLLKIVVYFKAEWFDDGYKGGTTTVMLIDPKISFSELVDKLYSRLSVNRSSFDILIYSLVKASNGMPCSRYLIEDDEVLHFAVEDQPHHVYLFVDTVARDGGPSDPLTQRVGSNIISNHDVALSESTRIGTGLTDINVIDDLIGIYSINELEERTDFIGTDESPDENTDNDNEDDMPRVTETSWELPGVSNYSFDEVIYSLAAPQRCGPLDKGSFFRSKSEIKLAIGKYALDNKFTAKIVRSNSIRFEVVCTDQACSFAFRVRRGKGGSLWHVTEFASDHSCLPDAHASYFRTMRTDVIGNLFLSRVIVTDYQPAHVINEMENRFQVKISYSKAWRAIRHALRLSYGSASDSYQHLPSYLEQLKISNPDTITSLKTDNENQFLYSFFALGASIRGFLSYIRPVVAIDATYLKGEYRGVILTATAKDGTDSIFPIAFGFADAEDNPSWTWFISMLRQAIGVPVDFVVVSDRHKSIAHAMKVVYPSIQHVICYYHLKGNLQPFCGRRSNVKSLLHKAAYSYSKDECDRFLGEIEKDCPKLFGKLRKIGKKRWTRAYCPRRRYDMMTSNIAESLNRAMGKARRLPVTASHEFLRSMTMQWFASRREAARRLKTTVTTSAVRHCDQFEEEVSNCNVRAIDEGRRYQVTHGDDAMVVDFVTNTC